MPHNDSDTAQDDKKYLGHKDLTIAGVNVPRSLGFIAIAACVIVVVCDVVMWFLVENYSPISQTISELAAGPYHWLQDIGIIIFVIGYIVPSFGFIFARRKRVEAVAGKNRYDAHRRRYSFDSAME